MVWIDINEKTLNKFRAEFKQVSDANMGEENDLLNLSSESNVIAKIEELNFSEGSIEFTYTYHKNGEQIIYLSDNVEIDLDLAAEIVSYYMKKLGKLKTVLEATK